LLLASCFLLLASAQSVYADTCKKEFVSIEEAYIASDIVFLGDAYNDDGETLFNIHEIYKHPAGFNKDKPLFQLTPNFSSIKFPVNGTKFIIYGKVSKKEDKNYVYSSSCGKTIPEAEEFFKMFDSQEKDKNSLYSSSALIYSGKVVSTKHEIIRREFIRSEIGFEVDTIYKNDSTEQNISNGSRVIINAVNCGQEFMIDRIYLVFVTEEKRRNSPDDYITKFSAWCAGPRPIDMNEKDILKKLLKYSSN